jgi:hypothetical protein
MKFTVLDRAFAPALADPMTYDRWMQINHSLDSCLEERGVGWVCSLVSVAGDRSLCLFEVPYTETVREACRTAQMPFRQVWPAQVWTDHAPRKFSQGQALVVAEVGCDPPITAEIYAASKRQAKGCFEELSIQHAWSMATLDGTHCACVFRAATAEDVRSLYRKTRSPFQQVWKASLIRPD